MDTMFEHPKQLGHVMLDLETMGKKSKSAIISIGAVEFDINTGETGREFYAKVNLQSCFNVGLIANGETIEWWLMQSEAARKMAADSKGVSLTIALCNFRVFMIDLGIDTTQIWGNGARFDIGILEDAYDACQLSNPWNFRLERDVRTLVSFAPKVKENAVFNTNGIEHDPIADAKFQIMYCTAVWQHLMKGSGNG
jgi:hypothetical protein